MKIIFEFLLSSGSSITSPCSLTTGMDVVLDETAGSKWKAAFSGVGARNPVTSDNCGNEKELENIH